MLTALPRAHIGWFIMSHTHTTCKSIFFFFLRKGSCSFTGRFSPLGALTRSRSPELCFLPKSFREAESWAFRWDMAWLANWSSHSPHAWQKCWRQTDLARWGWCSLKTPTVCRALEVQRWGVQFQVSSPRSVTFPDCLHKQPFSYNLESVVKKYCFKELIGHIGACESSFLWVS